MKYIQFFDDNYLYNMVDWATDYPKLNYRVFIYDQNLLSIELTNTDDRKNALDSKNKSFPFGITCKFVSIVYKVSAIV